MSLVAAFRVRQPTISRHLRVLREAGLVSVSEKGRYRLYSLNAERLRPAAVWLGSYEKFWERKLDALGSFLDRNQPVSRSVRHGGKPS